MLLGSGEVRSYELGPVVHYHSLVECLPYDEAVYMLKVTGAQLEHMLRFILREAFLGEHTEFYQFSHGMQIIWSRKEQVFGNLVSMTSLLKSISYILLLFQNITL